MGNVSCETKDLFNSDIQELAVDLNEMGSLKLSITVHWKPFVGEDIKTISASLLGDLGRMTSSSAIGAGESIPDFSADNVNFFDA